MEPQVVSKLHFKKCSYINCGVTSRNTSDGTSFHTFPIKDNDRCIMWLVNCGLDDWVLESDSFFKHKYICSRHFSKDCKHASGRLTKSAVPNLYDNDNNLESTTSHTTEIDVQALIKENNSLKKRLMEAEKTIEHERFRYESLLSRYQTTCKRSEKRRKV